VGAGHRLGSYPAHSDGAVSEQAQRFLSVFEPIRGHFCPRRHLLPAPRYRKELTARFQIWRQITGLAAA
jgi:putative transposase